MPVAVVSTGTFNGSGTPYVQPGTVGYLGLTSALTPYSPPGSGLPGAGNSPPDWGWEAYGMRNDDTDATLDHVQIYGGLYLTGQNLTITQSVIMAGTLTEFAPVECHGSVAGLITVHDSTLGWLSGFMPPAGQDVACIWDSGVMAYDVERCDMSGTPQGLNPAGSGNAAAPSLVINNWIHDLVQNNPAGPNHMDGIFCQGNTYLTIQGNYVQAPSRADVTACLFFQDRTANDVGYIVTQNYLSGGGNTFYNENGLAMVVTDNTFAGDGFYGNALNVAPGTIGTWTGNVLPDGTPVPSP